MKLLEYKYKNEVTIGYQKSDKGTNMDAFHYHNSYELIFMINGNKQIFFKDGYYNLNTGYVSLCPPNEPHKTIGSSAYERICINFTDNFLNKYFTPLSKNSLIKCFNHRIIKLKNDDYLSFKELVLNTQKKSLHTTNNANLFIPISQILCFLSSQSFSYPNNKIADTRLSKIINYICLNYQSITSIDDVAKQFFISKQYLCRLLNKKLHTTFTQYLNVIRVQHACDMLITTDYNITDVAMRCGFSSATYFGRVFKTLISMTPSEFKNVNSH